MAEHYENGGRLTRYNYAPNPEDFERGQMVDPELLRKLNYDSSSDSDETDDEYEYTLKKEKFYTQLFSKPLKKIRFAISSSDRDVSSYPNVEDCKILLNGSNNINEFDKVVGFNILGASIPVSYYNINTANKAVASHSDITGASNGYYTSSDLTSLGVLSSHDSKTGKFTFGSTVTTTGITPSDKSIAKVLGLGIHTNGTQYTSATAVMSDIRGTGFFDIEISNIPSIACIHSNHSKNIVARVPVNAGRGEIVEYKAQDPDMSRNHFFPIKLTHLDIKVLDEFGNNLGMNGVDYNLICEAIILGDLPENL